MNLQELNDALERDNCKLRLRNLSLETDNKNLWSAVRAHEKANKSYEELTNELKLELARAEREDQQKTQRIIDLAATIELLQAQVFSKQIINN